MAAIHESTFIHLTQSQAAKVISDAVSAALSGLSSAESQSGIKLMKVYSYRNVADILDTPIKSVYNIPEEELPRVRRAGSNVGVLGIQLLRYIHGLEPLDTSMMVDDLSELIKKQLEATASKPKIVPLPNGKKGTKIKVM